MLHDDTCPWLCTCHMPVYANCYEMTCICYEMWLLCGIWWMDMFMIWDVIVMWYLMNGYVYDMICWRHVRDMLCDCYDIGYDMCMMWIVMSERMKTLWYDICATWMIWHDWHAKRWTSMKYNSGIRMKVMINDTINIMRNDMIWRRR